MRPGHVSGVSGRTAGLMYRKANGMSRPSSERRGLRKKNQLAPASKGPKHLRRFPNGKYQPATDLL